MPRQETRTLYRFDELPAEGRKVAISNARTAITARQDKEGCNWIGEIRESCKAAIAQWRRIAAGDLSGGKYPEADSCQLTGYTADEDFISFIRKLDPTTAEARNVEQALWGIAQRLGDDEMEYEASDEAIIETLTNDDKEYTVNGKDA